MKRFALLRVQTLSTQSADIPYPHTTGGSREDLPSLEENGCRQLTSEVQRARLPCAGTESM